MFGLFAAAIGAISSFIAPAISAVSTALGSIGTAVATFAKGIAPTLTTIFETLKNSPIVEKALDIGKFLFENLDIFNSDESIKDMGERSIQAAEAGITPDKYDDFNDYMNDLRNFEIDPNKSHGDTVATVAGLGIGTLGIEKKFDLDEGSLSNLMLLPVANPDFFDEKKLENLVEKSPETIKDIFDYLKSNLDEIQEDKLESKLEKIFEVNSVDEKTNLQENLSITKTNFEEIQNSMKETENKE